MEPEAVETELQGLPEARFQQLRQLHEKYEITRAIQ